MRSAVGQVWHWPGTDEVILILAVSLVKEMNDDGEEDVYYSYDELNLETGRVWRGTPRSIEDDERWERWA